MTSSGVLHCLLLLIFLPICAGGVVNIATYYSLTGTYASRSAPTGWEFWARWVNTHRGGILVNGRRHLINLTLWDDQSNRTEAARLFQMFVDQGYDFVIGGHTSMADVAGAFFEPHRVLNIMCCTGPDWYYTSPPRQWLFGIHRSSLDYPKGFLRQMLIRELRDVAILFNSGTGFTTSTADSAETFAINIGLRVVYKAAFVGTGYTAGAGRGYEELREHVRRVQEIQGENAKVALLFCTLEPDGNDAARIVAELGIDPSAVWISVAPTMGTRFVQAVGPRAAEYAFAPLQWHASLAFTDPIFGHSEAFVTNFTATYGFKPDYTVSSGAAAGIALQLAIESADSLEVGAVAQALRELRTETFFGEIAFNRYQRNYGGTTATIQILNGNSFAVMPESGAQMFPELPPSRAERAACPEAVFLNNFTQCRARIGDMRVTGIVVPVVATMLLLAIVGGVGCWRHKRDNSRAPRGTGVPFGVMFTDIQSSTALWACVAADMARALDTHHAHIRLLIRRHKCYEVKTIGDSFMVVSESPVRLFRLALDIQTRLHAVDWQTRAIDTVYQELEAKACEDLEGGEDRAPPPLTSAQYKACWSGLRVSKGYDYYGTVVNTAARIEGVCHGGQIAVSAAFLDALPPPVRDEALWHSLDAHLLPGLSEAVRMHQALPPTLRARQFPPLRLDKPVQGPLTSDDRRESLHLQPSIHLEDVMQAHPLIQTRRTTVHAFRAHYDHCVITITNLLACTSPAVQRDHLKTYCDRLKVPFKGAQGSEREETIHNLAMRILPSTFPEEMGVGLGSSERRTTDEGPRRIAVRPSSC